jgi:hypothetical protein
MAIRQDLANGRGFAGCYDGVKRSVRELRRSAALLSRKAVLRGFG